MKVEHPRELCISVEDWRMGLEVLVGRWRFPQVEKWELMQLLQHSCGGRPVEKRL